QKHFRQQRSDPQRPHTDEELLIENFQEQFRPLRQLPQRGRLADASIVSGDGIQGPGKSQQKYARSRQNTALIDQKPPEIPLPDTLRCGHQPQRSPEDQAVVMGEGSQQKSPADSGAPPEAPFPDPPQMSQKKQQHRQAGQFIHADIKAHIQRHKILASQQTGQTAAGSASGQLLPQKRENQAGN